MIDNDTTIYIYYRKKASKTLTIFFYKLLRNNNLELRGFIFSAIIIFFFKSRMLSVV